MLARLQYDKRANFLPFFSFFFPSFIYRYISLFFKLNLIVAKNIQLVGRGRRAR